MLEALAEFEAVMKASHDGLYATDPKIYGIAKGLYRLAYELNDRLANLEQAARVTASRLERIEAGVGGLK